ncbi:MAG: oxidoreductase [Alphaproteobacteria bacterium]|nr:oxidoreductase [Alphaproteobacteria bacterium]
MSEPGKFRALVLTETEGKVVPGIETLPDTALPSGGGEGDVTVRVAYSTLNYKDGLILGGLGKLVRRYPHVPGIDFSGTVETSASLRYRPGDPVILTGWRVGESHWGGYAERARVQAEWLVPLPDGLTLKRAMALGTAGFTAMLAVIALEDHGLSPAQNGPVLVTGASGGVGSVAVAVLARLGYKVTAVTGRAANHDYLKALGAADILDRAEIAQIPVRPLASERWLGCVDTVGGTTLANVLTSLRQGGSVAACGNAGGNELPTTVLPFLLRGVNLLGIGSVLVPYEQRVIAWKRLVRDLPMDKLDAMTQTIPLEALPAWGIKILSGSVRGRTVVDMADVGRIT